MTDLYCSANSADAAVLASAEEPKFYIVSHRKFTVLFLATMSMYCVYWFYKNWDRYKEHSPFATTQATAI